MNKIFYLFGLLLLLVPRTETAAQTDTTVMTARQVKKWFGENAWQGSIPLEPHKTINKTEFARQYHLNKTYWDKAFAYLREKDLKQLATGRYPIDGDNVFVIITENPTKDFDSTRWESHRNYIDLHYVVSGEEKIGVYPVNKLVISKPYDASADIMNYTGTGEIYNALPGTFFLFFPTDAHRPAISPGGNKTDKKIVIKIRYTP